MAVDGWYDAFYSTSQRMMAYVWAVMDASMVFCFLGSVGIFVYFLLILSHIISIIYGKLHLHRMPSATNIVWEELPGVTILKPLVGVDPNLKENLETFFNLNYPKYELFVCVQDEGDPAIKVVEPLIQKYPDIDAHLFIGRHARIGANPKLNNLMSGYKASKYNLILISDSSIKTTKDTLLDMVMHMTPGVGIVHQLPFTCDRKGFSCTLEKVFFGGWHSRMYLTMCAIRTNCVTGMSNLIRKSIIDENGGLEELSKYIAEDFYMGLITLNSGYKQQLSSIPVYQNSGISSLQNFRKRMIRWTQIRISTVPAIILAEPITESLALGIWNAWSVSYLLGWDPIVFFLAHILIWMLLGYIQLKIVQNDRLNFSKFDFVIAWLYREIMTPYLFMKGMMKTTVTWRNQVYKLKWGGELEEVR
ncbi:ceramide glucosyltransferase-like isoform X2 [Anneissia japonica]|uniref:ceramide glucosyltransferase-like isoform X2 n=1 Tax=Anneissia japonica TaxID=1529436 RepID=UPI001425943D|nr:ceramide glucosyltransferase-like isoform X2 [Anneissia japonica]